VQDLHEGDYELRAQYCNWLLNQNQQNPAFISKILWTDEATFTRDGVFNYHNNHYWAVQNPRLFRSSRHQHKFSVNVWAGIIGSHLLGPCILPHRLNHQNFLNFLNNDFVNLLEDIPLAILRNMWLQLDGATPHFALLVRTWLNESYPNRSIGRGGPVAWPARSPGLTPMDGGRCMEKRTRLYLKR
jgi:hypothetical protein